jgi:surfactin synthase thioesterase subunit
LSIRFRHLILLLGCCASACQSLPPGRIDAVAARSTLPRSGHVYLIRGWQDLYSKGIDTLAAELRDAGVASDVYRASQWQELAAAIANGYPRSSSQEPLVLIGFSYGADDVILVARHIATMGVVVDLLVTIDPVTPAPVPGNVRECRNFYKPNGVLDVFPWFRGVPLASDRVVRLCNIDLPRDRSDLLQPDTSHFNIAANPKLHLAILEKVLAVCVPRAVDDRVR